MKMRMCPNAAKHAYLVISGMQSQRLPTNRFCSSYHIILRRLPFLFLPRYAGPPVLKLSSPKVSSVAQDIY
jgi:hypothetical protein